jgi:hypothetical protein
MGQKSIFHPREPHILSRLDVLVLYINFRGSKKYRVSAQNQMRLPFDFTKNIYSR